MLYKIDHDSKFIDLFASLKNVQETFSILIY